MGNKDYRKFSENSNNNPTINTEELGQNIMPTPPAPPAPPVTNNELQINEANVLNITPVNEVPKDANVIDGVNIVETPKTPAVPVRTDGRVANCVKLNVRKEPKKDAEVAGILNNGVFVVVEVEKSTDEFYKVRTPGVEGYCMKEFIEVK